MAQRCDVCGKHPSVGNTVSHAHKLTRRRWLRISSRCGIDAREAHSRSSVHPLSQGGQSHEGHLSTNGRGQCPLPIGKVGGRHPPPCHVRPYFFFFLAAFFFFAIPDLTSSVPRRMNRSPCYFFFFLAAFFFAMESFTSLRFR